MDWQHFSCPSVPGSDFEVNTMLLFVLNNVGTLHEFLISYIAKETKRLKQTDNCIRVWK